MATTNAQIKKWNEIFKKASKPEKKILIAKDILANLKTGKYIAHDGHYFYNIHEIMMDGGTDNDIQKNLYKVEACECCALGACLISSTKYQNKLLFKDLNISSFGDSWTQLKSIFTVREISIMENCFEGYSSAQSRVARDKFEYELDEKTMKRCDDFYIKHVNSNKRLIAICNNIIKNKGYIKI